jgi:hypothetical protein
MFADYYHADLFSAGDENSPAGACFSRFAADKFSGACEASAISRQSNQAWMRGKYFESTGDANELDLAQAAREFALTGRAVAIGFVRSG